MSDLNIVSSILGACLSAIFIIYFLLSYLRGRPEPKLAGEAQTTNPLPRKMTGAFSLLLGFLLFVACIYFSFRDRLEINAEASSNLIVQGVFMFISSVSLMVAGIAMITHWKHCGAVFLSALGIFSFSALLCFLQQGQGLTPELGQEHKNDLFFINQFYLVIAIVLVYFVGIIYGFEHFLLHLDESRKDSRSETIDSHSSPVRRSLRR